MARTWHRCRHRAGRGSSQIFSKNGQGAPLYACKRLERQRTGVGLCLLAFVCVAMLPSGDAQEIPYIQGSWKITYKVDALTEKTQFDCFA